jgi:hypothetical protein
MRDFWAHGKACPLGRSIRWAVEVGPARQFAVSPNFAVSVMHSLPCAMLCHGLSS